MTARQLFMLAMLAQLMWAGLFVYISNSSLSSPWSSSSSSPFDKATVVTQKRKRTESSCSTSPPNCPTSAPEKEDYDTSLLLLIVSDIDSSADRQAARDTWLAKAKAVGEKQLVFKFVIGVPDRNDRTHERVAHELTTHRDIVFVVGFRGATQHGHNIKLVLRWALENYRFRHFMKVDSTAFVMIEKVLGTLEKLEDRVAETLVWGEVDYDVKKYTGENGRAFNWLFRDYGVPVLSSTGYVLSRRVVGAIAGEEDIMLQRANVAESITLSVWLSVFRLEYLSFNTYRPSSTQPICPDDKSDVVLYSYTDPADAFRKLNFCLYLEESWFAEDHSQAVSMLRKKDVVHVKRNTV